MIETHTAAGWRYWLLSLIYINTLILRTAKYDFRYNCYRIIYVIFYRFKIDQKLKSYYYNINIILSYLYTIKLPGPNRPHDSIFRSVHREISRWSSDLPVRPYKSTRNEFSTSAAARWRAKGGRRQTTRWPLRWPTKCDIVELSNRVDGQRPH